MNYYWEKSNCWTDIKCALCGLHGVFNKDGSIGSGDRPYFSRKWNSKKWEDSSDDDCIVTLCEECFIKTR